MVHGQLTALPRRPSLQLDCREGKASRYRGREESKRQDRRSETSQWGTCQLHERCQLWRYTFNNCNEEAQDSLLTSTCPNIVCLCGMIASLRWTQLTTARAQQAIPSGSASHRLASAAMWRLTISPAPQQNTVIARSMHTTTNTLLVIAKSNLVLYFCHCSNISSYTLQLWPRPWRKQTSVSFLVVRPQNLGDIAQHHIAWTSTPAWTFQKFKHLTVALL